MSKRQSLTKTTRFEVFKRDGFQCQYCGGKAPDVTLQVDHIEPVAKGGTNDLLNLVTSCDECNAGKGAKRLDDQSAVQVQRQRMDDLHERREQLEMLKQWRDDLQMEEEGEVDAVEDRIIKRSTLGLTKAGRSVVRKWLKKHTLAQLLEAVDEAFSAYLKWRGDEPDQDSWELAFSKVAGVARVQSLNRDRPYMRDLFYIQGIVRRRSGLPHYKCVDFLEHCHLRGGFSIEELKRRACEMQTLEDFEGALDSYLDGLGEPF